MAIDRRIADDRTGPDSAPASEPDRAMTQPDTETEPADTEGDRLRAELRSLGYLENPLSRFFAGGLSGKRPALRTHLRVGMGVGGALGIASALLSLPISLSAPGDAPSGFALIVLVVAFATASLCGLLAAGAMFLLYRSTRRLVDRARLVARSTGVAVFLLAFFYLLSYWRRYGSALSETLGVAVVLRPALAAAVIVAISLGLARLFHLAAYAVLASIRGYEFTAKKSGARRALLVGVALAVIAAYAAVGSRPGEGPREFAEVGDPIVAEPPLAKRVILVAVDGLDHAQARAVAAKGWMPTLARWMESGVVAAVDAPAADIPPAYWTTIATGLGTKRHRIDAYYQSRVLGLSQAFARDHAPPGIFDALLLLSRVLGLEEEVPVTASTSRVKRIGDVAAAAGRSAASVNFWATYPAPAFAGTTISERAYLVLRAEQSHGAPVDPAIAPEATWPTLRRFLFDESIAAERVPSIAQVGLEGNFATIHPLLYDLFVEAAALDVLTREAPDYLQVGLTGLDVLRYAYFVREPATTDVRLAAQTEVLRGVYGALDRFLAELRAAAGDDAIVALVTCPGISSRSREARGLLVMTGPTIASEDLDSPLAPEDLAPTLLFAMGLPSSEEQDGRVETRIFSAAALAHPTRATRMVRSFGQKPRIEFADESSAEALRFLEQFGYLSSR